MPLDPSAVRIANANLWAANPGLGGRQLTSGPADAALRAEWQGYYRAAASATPPAPAATPTPTPAPTAAPPVVHPCGAPPAPVALTDCSKMKDHVREGDIVLRGDPSAESRLLSGVSNCDYSHAGIVARDASGNLVVVDAYPGRPSGAVAPQSVDDFFCHHGATQGLVTRPKNCAAAVAASQWAYAQTSDPAYEFNLWDPWNSDPKKLYCADFVYQSFQSAGVDLVPTKMDFMDSTNRARTLEVADDFIGWQLDEAKQNLEAARASGDAAAIAAAEQAVKDARKQYWGSYLLTDSKLEGELRSMSGGTTEYITPCQIGENAGTDRIATFTAPGTGTPGKK